MVEASWEEEMILAFATSIAGSYSFTIEFIAFVTAIIVAFTSFLIELIVPTADTSRLSAILAFPFVYPKPSAIDLSPPTLCPLLPFGFNLPPVVSMIVPSASFITSFVSFTSISFVPPVSWLLLLGPS